MFSPAYLCLGAQEVARRAGQAMEHLRACDLCPLECRVDRTAGGAGTCLIGSEAVVATFRPSFNEEISLTGARGSGAVYFAGCSLHCLYCHNARFSQSPAGNVVSPEILAEIFLNLQRLGCANLHLITPTHILPHILAALAQAIPRGLELPVVYNTSGYERVEILALLEGIVDVYLPDLKYIDEELAYAHTGVPRYPAVTQAAIDVMVQQVGWPIQEADGALRRGVLVRHLVLPGFAGNTARVIHLAAEHLGAGAWLSLLRYRPYHLARKMPPLERALREDEYQQAVFMARRAGLVVV
jgi:putative pyruvate formate lyase activating enzyme